MILYGSTGKKIGLAVFVIVCLIGLVIGIVIYYRGSTTTNVIITPSPSPNKRSGVEVSTPSGIYSNGIQNSTPSGISSNENEISTPSSSSNESSNSYGNGNVLSDGKYNITIENGRNCNKYLSTTGCDYNLVDMYDKDDGSGRQQWILTSIPDKQDTYTISIENGRTSCNKYLSTSECNSNLVDMYDKDDGSGRQQWKLTSIPNKNDTFNLTIENGRNCNKYLSTSECNSNLVDMYDKDDGSGRQQWTFTPAIWSLMNGSLKQVQLDKSKDIVCGVNSSDDIFCADTNIFINPNWFQISGKLKHISVSNGKLYGVNSDNQIFFKNNYNNNNEGWTKIGGSLKQVDIYGDSVCGVNSSDEVFCKDNLTDSNWVKIPVNFKHVSINDNKMYGINSLNQIFYNNNYKNSNVGLGTGGWTQISGSLIQIDINGDNICGINDSSEAFCWVNNGWKKYPGKFKYITTKNKKLYAVNDKNQIFSSS